MVNVRPGDLPSAELEPVAWEEYIIQTMYFTKEYLSIEASTTSRTVDEWTDYSSGRKDVVYKDLTFSPRI